ncbi:MAG: hypothetical protein KDD62_07375 [Bdellovibrionales bacterium]|nr:hypothetical protein [Bdellovibrionales bacterium]
MMIKQFVTGILLLILAVNASATPDTLSVGDTYKLGSTDFKVVGVSADKAFEYTASGESLQLVIGTTPGTIVIVPKAGEVVKVDPSVPMVWIAGKPDEQIASNTYLKKHGKNQQHILLELLR